MDAKIIEFEPKKQRAKKKKKSSDKDKVVMAIRERLDLLLEQIVEIHKCLDEL